MWSARRPLVPRHGAHGRMSTYRGHAVAAGISATQNMSAVAGANHPVLSGLFHLSVRNVVPTLINNKRQDLSLNDRC
jgi:hypothetical protein